jgi:hypothetical protein
MVMCVFMLMAVRSIVIVRMMLMSMFMRVGMIVGRVGVLAIMIVGGVGVLAIMIVGGVGVLTFHQHASFARGDATAVDGIKDECRAQVECRGGLLKKRGRDTGVDESAEEHVPAEAGKAFEIADTHGCFL